MFITKAQNSSSQAKPLNQGTSFGAAYQPGFFKRAIPRAEEFGLLHDVLHGTSKYKAVANGKMIELSTEQGGIAYRIFTSLKDANHKLFHKVKGKLSPPESQSPAVAKPTTTPKLSQTRIKPTAEEVIVTQPAKPTPEASHVTTAPTKRAAGRVTIDDMNNRYLTDLIKLADEGSLKARINVLETLKLLRQDANARGGFFQTLLAPTPEGHPSSIVMDYITPTKRKVTVQPKGNLELKERNGKVTKFSLEEKATRKAHQALLDSLKTVKTPTQKAMAVITPAALTLNNVFCKMF